MSRGASIMLGIAFVFLAVGFIAVTYLMSNLEGKRAGAVGGAILAIFCGLGAVASLLPASRPVTLRLLGGTVFLVCCGYLIEMLNGGEILGRSRADQSLIKALLAFSVFGIPGGYVALTGRYPQWGRYASVFGGSETRHSRTGDSSASKPDPPVL